MRVSNFSRILASAALAMALGTACASTGGSDTEQMAKPSQDFGQSSMGNGSEGDMTGQSVADLETVYFDFDRAVIRDDQKPTLRQNAAAIRNNSTWKTVVIEGHCDERGTEEYNLALGERRANSVRQYLVDSGIPSSRLDTVSFGEGKPAVQGHDESAWKWNRRAQFRVIR